MHKEHDPQEEKNLMSHYGIPTWIILGWWSVWGFIMVIPSVAVAAGFIPGTYPISSETQLDVKANVTMNGTVVSGGITGAHSVVASDGTRSTVTQVLPSLDPPIFPGNASTTNATEAQSPFVHDTETFYNKVTVAAGTTASLSGGGPIHIKTLTVNDGATVQLGTGVYFINKLDLAHLNTTLQVTSTPVILHIGSEFKLDGAPVTVNAGGTVDGLRIFLHQGVTAKGGSPLNLTGLIYGPESGLVTLKANSSVHGAIIINGAVKLEVGVAITYTAADQAAVSAIDPADTGGGSNTPPEANAGLDQVVQVNDLIQLDGSGSSDADGDTLSFVWTLESQPTGSSATLTDATGVLPTLTIDEPGDYVVQLIVNDGTDDSAPDTVMLSTGNVAPVAHAGPDQTVAVTQPAFLDGTGSTDANGDALTYQWTITSQPANSSTMLDDPASVTPSFTVDQVGTYTVTLLVSDGLLTSEADLVIIATDNSAPVANAGPDHDVRPGTTVTLDGTGSSDADGDPLTYQWTQTVVPLGNAATISDPTAAMPTLTPDVEGDYVAQLQVDDGTAMSEPDTALIRVGNTAPIADAGPDQSVAINSTVQLDGNNSSDPQGDVLTYQWTLTTPAGSSAMLSDAASAQPTFETDLEGDYVAMLIVNDGDLDSPSDSMTVFVTATSPPPTITGFSPNTASIGELITVTGTDLVSSTGEVGQVVLVQQGGGTMIATVTSSNPTTLTFVVPSGAATGLVTVTVAGETAISTNPLTIVPSQTFDLLVEPGEVSVQPGQSVAVAVKATSSSGFTQLATLGVTGLPAGVTSVFQPPHITAGQTVLLTLTAPPTQTPSTTPFEVTATAQVEGLAVVKTGTGTLTVHPLTTSFLGRTVVANTLQTPLAGVTVTMLGQDGSGQATGCVGQTVSDLAGNFALTNLPAECVGGQLIRYKGGTATAPPGVYAGVDKFYALTLNQATTPPVLVHLPRIDTAETIMVQQNAAVDQTMTFPTIPQLSLTIHAGTVFTLEDGTQPNPFPLTAVEIPTDRLPGGTMPSDPQSVVPFLVGFQPANTSVNQPVPVVFPNRLTTPPGTGVSLLTLDPTQGVMVHYGTGTVAGDSTHIMPDVDPTTGKGFGLTHLGWHGPQNPPNEENPSPDEDHPECADPIDLSSGILVIRATDLEIRGGRGRIGIDRTYRSLTTNVGPFGIGTNHTYGYRLNTNNPLSSTVINLIMPNDNRFALVKQLDGTFTNSTIPSVRGAVLTVAANNESDLRWKDGTVFHFVPSNFQLGSVLQSITDRNGNQVTLVRPSSSQPLRVTQIKDPVGRALHLTYDSNNRITSVTDPINRTVAYTYNSQGTLETVTDPEGGVTQYDYDTNNQLITITDARGIVVAQNTYDANGRVIEQIQADGGVWAFAYELFNPLVALSPIQATTVIDPRGNPTTFRFSPQGFVLSRTDELGQTTQFEKENGTNLEISRTDFLGRTIHFTYDDQGNRTSTQDLEGNVITFEYGTPFNLRTKIIDEFNQVTEFAYDSANGNLLTTTDPLLHTTTRTYNTFGQLATVQGPIATEPPTIFTYDAHGNLIATRDPLGHATGYEYDAVSRLITLTDSRGFARQTQYDDLDRITQTTDALQGLTKYTYDPNGNVETVTDAKDQTTTSTYDVMNQLETRSDPLGRTESYFYDLSGNLARFVDRKGQESLFTYDKRNRQIEAQYIDVTTTFVYDNIGRLVQTTDSLSGSIESTYDDRNRLIREVTPQGVIEYTYDALGQRTTMIANGQEPVRYQYEGGNINRDSRLTEVRQGTQIIGLDYDPAGKKTSLTYPNGTTTSYTYDNASRLTNIRHQGPGATMIEELTYTYDAAGNRLTVNRANAAATLLPDAMAATYDAANQLIQLNGVTLTYDLNGNLTSDGTTNYTWDARNRLIALAGPAITASFAYDAKGRRISKTINGITTEYHYDRKDIIMESQGSAVVATYLRKLCLDTAYVRQTADGNEYYHTDTLGSTLVLTNDTGAVSDQYQYQPFGRTQHTGTSTNPFQFTGRERDTAELYYYRARYHAPGLGRFVSEDPLRFDGGSPNFYSYVDNNPLRFSDPLGQEKCDGADRERRRAKCYDKFEEYRNHDDYPPDTDARGCAEYRFRQQNMTRFCPGGDANCLQGYLDAAQLDCNAMTKGRTDDVLKDLDECAKDLGECAR